ncbi:MAG: metalloregulator ArsR/SmtB family transcription factor [Sphingorhabdus sp.]
MELTPTSSSTAVDALSALAQEHRLAAFRMLVQAGADGLSAGDIARKLDLAPSSLSFHLAQLSRAGLISDERRSRSIIYRANFAAMNRLLGFLTENCCRGVDAAAERKSV